MQQRSALRGFALVLCLLTSALAYAQAPRVLTGIVVKVVDGDTIHVRVGDRIEKIRYIGMNAPVLTITRNRGICDRLTIGLFAGVP